MKKLLTPSPPHKKIGQTVRNWFLGPVMNFPGVGFYDLISFNILEGMRDRPGKSFYGPKFKIAILRST